MAMKVFIKQRILNDKWRKKQNKVIIIIVLYSQKLKQINIH